MSMRLIANHTIHVLLNLEGCVVTLDKIIARWQHVSVGKTYNEVNYLKEEPYSHYL